jgi:hypothetical protein
MEQQIMQLIEEEVSRRAASEVYASLQIISKIYDVPIEQLAKDTACVKCTFCKGLLKSKKPCLKNPKENGYCGFHQSQAPPPPPKPIPRVKAPWET